MKPNLVVKLYDSLSEEEKQAPYLEAERKEKETKLIAECQKAEQKFNWQTQELAKKQTLRYYSQSGQDVRRLEPYMLNTYMSLLVKLDPLVKEIHRLTFQ